MEESAAQTARRHGDFGAMHANRSTEEANVEGTFCYRIVTALLQHDAEGDSKQPPAPDLVNCTVLADQQSQLWVADMTYGTPRQRSPPGWGPSCLSMSGMHRSSGLMLQ